MKTIYISKGPGKGYRTICIPEWRERKACKKIMPVLRQNAEKADTHNVAHGFRRMRSAVTNAQQHVGYEWTITVDLEDCFGHVKGRNAVLDADRRVLLASGECSLLKATPLLGVPQGFPTSPHLANIALAKLDDQIISAIAQTSGKAIMPGQKEKPGDWQYTRYADDITVSCMTEFDAHYMLEVIQRVCAAMNYPIAKHKTRIQSARAGRRTITGIAVDETLHPTRAARRKLRAAKHNQLTGKCVNFPERKWTAYKKKCKQRKITAMPKRHWIRRLLKQRVRGLEQWLKLRPPRVGHRTIRQLVKRDPWAALRRLSGHE